MAMEDEYDPFDVGGQGYVPDTPGYQASKGTAASQLGYTAQDVYNNDSDSVYATKVNRGMSDGRGLNQQQFQARFGMTPQNPYGRDTGFARFMSKFGKTPDYTQQLQALQPRRGTVFRGGVISKGGQNLGMSVQDYVNTYGTPAEQIMKKQYDAYRNPYNLPDVEGYDPRQRTASQEDIEAGKVVRGRSKRGSYLGPLEDIVREQSTGEMIARALMPAGTGLIDTTDLYESAKVTPDMRDRGPQNILAQATQAITGVNPQQAKDKIVGAATSLGDQMMGIFSGQKAPLDELSATDQAVGPMAIAAGPRPAAGITATSVGNSVIPSMRNAPNYGLGQDFSGGTYDEAAPQIVNVPTPVSMPDEIRTMRDTLNDVSVFGPNEGGAPVTIAIPMPRPERNAPNYGFERPVNAPNYGMYPIPEPDMDAMASYRGSRATPVGPDMDATASYRGSRATPVEEGMTYLNDMYGPRTPDDLRAMGIEPSLDDLMSMDLTPAQIIQEGMRQSQPSTQAAPAGDLLSQALAMEAAGTPMVAATSSLEDFVNRNPGVGEALLNSREGQQLNDIMRFGGLDKDKPIKTFVDPETAEIKVQGYDYRGGAKGFNIDASDFFGKIDIVDLLADTLQKGGMTGLADESQRERSERMNQEFLDSLEETERRAAEQGGIFSNIGYRG
jgi:hypothetical protein